MALYKPCAIDVGHFSRKPAAGVEVGGGDWRARSLLFRASWDDEARGRADQTEGIDGESGAPLVSRRDLTRRAPDGSEGLASRTAYRRSCRLASDRQGVARTRSGDRERRAQAHDLIDVGTRPS